MLKRLATLIVSGLMTATVFASVAACADASLSGDDNRDGIIMEDESGWDCRTMGNRICG